MIDVSYAEVVRRADAPDGSAARLGSAPSSPAARYHHHRWSAWAGNSRWFCDCGAQVHELRRADGTIVALPKAIA